MLLLAFMLTLKVYSQITVNTYGKKYVLLEAAMSAKALYTPDADVYMNNIRSSIPQAICIGLHANSTLYKDGMTDTAWSVWESNYVFGYPEATVNRSTWSTGGSTNYYFGRGSWTNIINDVLLKAPYFDLKMVHTFNTSTRVITVNLTAKALKTLTGTYNLNVYIVEDSVSGTGSGYNQINYYNTQSGHPFYGAGDPIIGYKHRMVLRSMLGGVWGAFGANNPSKDTSILKTFTFSVPSNYNLNRIRIIGMVSQSGTLKSEKTIQNCVQAKLVQKTCYANIAINTDSIGCVKYYNFIFADSSQVLSGTYTRIWDFGNGKTATTPDGSASFNTLGLHPVKLTITSNTGCVDSTTILIRSIPNPVAGSIIGQSTFADTGSVVTYRVNISQLDSVIWGVSHGNILFGQGTDSIRVKWIGKGTGFVKAYVFNSARCYDTASVNIIVGPVGLNNINNYSEVKVYPNPANDLVYVELAPELSNASLTLYDLNGKVCQTDIGASISVKNLPSGMYFLSIKNEKMVITRKIAIE